ncbi:ceramide synthase 6 [Contarinia nasturtii]|uniref:ceramide synthase 6 n=1 Tax=Contarinia nasturtii TaxID=265458 RepID=UPI0012D3A229|nr:ceramide synthase 6 [Contarinia nasturtii]XP_031637329.1 ceramide synthase 6 [Contarinia nasturtii]XP_031637330.1 ceramide synthase 6 [Contarinia nasturtii]XP_031637331.1 ceramide synthase 6 [Contarinia nasturtii]
MGIYRYISDTFWSTSVWLPPNTTWADIAPGSRPDVDHADYRDLWWPIPMAIVLLIIRFCVEKYILSPFGKSLGIKSARSKRATPNPILEDAYSKCSRIHHKTVIGLAKQMDMTERQIERWWRYRRAQDKPSTLVKFCENSWRFLYYTHSFAFGLFVLWDKSWFWDVKHCWHGYPHQSVDSEIWSYYMFSMSFYWALVASQFFDIKRKDFWQMFVHHIVTLLLLSLSWICNLHRVGSLVLVIHDCADIFLEAAKITKYANYQKLCDAIFALFTFIWIVTRLGFYPRIIYSSTVEAPRILPMFPAYYIFNSLLILLLCLHVAWTYMILKIAHNSLKSGKMEGDCRSSSSELSDSSESVKGAANGTPQKKSVSKLRSTSNSPKHSHKD